MTIFLPLVKWAVTVFLFRIDKVPVKSGIVKAKLFLAGSRHFRGVSIVRIGIGGPEGHMTVSLLSPKVLIEKGIGHETIDPGKSFVCE